MCVCVCDTACSLNTESFFPIQPAYITFQRNSTSNKVSSLSFIYEKKKKKKKKKKKSKILSIDAITTTTTCCLVASWPKWSGCHLISCGKRNGQRRIFSSFPAPFFFLKKSSQPYVTSSHRHQQKGRTYLHTIKFCIEPPHTHTQNFFF